MLVKIQIRTLKLQPIYLFIQYIKIPTADFNFKVVNTTVFFNITFCILPTTMSNNKENIEPKSAESQHHHMLTDYECGLTIGLYHEKKNGAYIARIFNLNERAVRAVIKRYNETGSELPRKHSGIKRKLVERDDRGLFRDAEKVPEMTFEQHRAHLANVGVNVTLPTVSSAFRRLGYRSYVATKKPALTKSQKEARVKWAKEHVNWTVDQWKNVMWSDESSYFIKPPTGKKRVVRKKGKKERISPKNTRSTTAYGGGRVMVWGCFWEGGFSPLHDFKGSVTSIVYTECLEKTFIP
jgi:transposase